MFCAHPVCPRPLAGSQVATTPLLEEKKAPKKPHGLGDPNTIKIFHVFCMGHVQNKLL